MLKVIPQPRDFFPLGYLSSPLPDHIGDASRDLALALEEQGVEGSKDLLLLVDYGYALVQPTELALPSFPSSTTLTPPSPPPKYPLVSVLPADTGFSPQSKVSLQNASRKALHALMHHLVLPSISAPLTWESILPPQVRGSDYHVFIFP